MYTSERNFQVEGEHYKSMHNFEEKAYEKNSACKTYKLNGKAM